MEEYVKAKAGQAVWMTSSEPESGMDRSLGDSSTGITHPHKGSGQVQESLYSKSLDHTFQRGCHLARQGQ